MLQTLIVSGDRPGASVQGGRYHSSLCFEMGCEIPSDLGNTTHLFFLSHTGLSLCIVQFTALKTLSRVQVALSSAGSDLQCVADNLHVAAASAVVGVGLSCFLL